MKGFSYSPVKAPHLRRSVMGLFGKSKKELLEWQNLIVDTPVNRLLMTEKQLKMHSKPIIDNHIRIFVFNIQVCAENRHIISAGIIAGIGIILFFYKTCQCAKRRSI